MELLDRAVEENRLQAFIDAVRSDEKVSRLTHTFYKYPARFSPKFAKAAITAFSDPGDLILDPFMGGGTTLVEARVCGRCAIGSDISSLAVFLARVKTTIYSDEELDATRNWVSQLPDKLNCHKASGRLESPLKKWIQKGYQRNLDTKETWPIRKLLEQAVRHARKLENKRIENLARCGILTTGQWALDSRQNIPTASSFRNQLVANIFDLCERASDYKAAVFEVDQSYRRKSTPFIETFNCSAEEVSKHVAESGDSPRLILTSPPYPGVHVLYHRWQVKGRRETPAPFWIANCVDGEGESYYTMGGRHQEGLPQYFETTEKVFSSLADIADKDTLVIQMLGFSDSSWQLPKYLETMEKVGFEEHKIDLLSNSTDGRLWRGVPNRKWYADQKGDTSSSQEVVLFHRLK